MFKQLKMENKFIENFRGKALTLDLKITHWRSSEKSKIGTLFYVVRSIRKIFA